MENEENTLSVYRIVRDRYGKKHKVYSARFKDIQTVTDFTTKYLADNNRTLKYTVELNVEKKAVRRLKISQQTAFFVNPQFLPLKR